MTPLIKKQSSSQRREGLSVHCNFIFISSVLQCLNAKLVIFFHTMKLKKIFYQRDGVKQDKNRIDLKILSAKSNELDFGNSKGDR